jgi:hypothetical protein
MATSTADDLPLASFLDGARGRLMPELDEEASATDLQKQPNREG